MPNSDWVGWPVLASIVNRSSFLVGDLLLGKLGETVVVHGNAPHATVGEDLAWLSEW